MTQYEIEKIRKTLEKSPYPQYELHDLLDNVESYDQIFNSIVDALQATTSGMFSMSENKKHQRDRLFALQATVEEQYNQACRELQEQYYCKIYGTKEETESD